MQQNDENRRSFLKQVLAGSAAVAGVTLAAKKTKASAPAKKQQTDEILYHESEYFKKYYDSLR